SYNAVIIGTQCWMAENLNIGTYRNNSVDQSNNSIFEKYCYNNTPANCDIYGGLYQWDEAMQYVTEESVQGICPDGWHFPSDGEWMIMEEYLGMCSGAGAGCSGASGWRGIPTSVGDQLKTSGSFCQGSTPPCADSGFEAKPGGYMQSNDEWRNIGLNAVFHNSSSSGGATGYRWLTYEYISIGRGATTDFAYSVRCLKD
ncbi:MAG: hypothetical protein KJ607_06635, partial [Bacteroidetes bacterium]|nr:hypothetical protein [Bacteroidota bacterium]